MSVVRRIRRHLSWKLFSTYLLIIGVGSIGLISTAELVMPIAFERHLAAMAARMGDATTLSKDLFANFRHALTESIAVAMSIATIMAIMLSLYVSRRVVAPIQEMMRVSRRIATGRYKERIDLFLDGSVGEGLDELGQLALSFNRMAAALEKTESMRRELIGNVAHELRSPLTSIKGYMEGLIDGVLPAEGATFERVYREADHLHRLVRDLQELSRIEEGAFPLNLRPVSAESLVEATAERLRPQFEDKGVALETDLASDLPRILGDEDRLGQVLLNLVGNALQYTPSGGWVRVDARRERGFVRVSVIDKGIGIAAEHLAYLFDRFYRVDSSRSRVGGGTGIGLTIARCLIEAHGGEIAVASEGLNKGSTFTFTVPVA